MEGHGWIQYGPANPPAQQRGGARGIFWDPVQEAQDQQVQEQEAEGEELIVLVGEEPASRVRPYS
eukprot:13092277-Heterocapsa_arctica.AAC.1